MNYPVEEDWGVCCCCCKFPEFVEEEPGSLGSALTSRSDSFKKLVDTATAAAAAPSNPAATAAATAASLNLFLQL